MGLGKTFTHSIAREIGRNYGKAASNYLLGDKHSTPIRMVGGSQDVSRKRGRVYHNEYDKAIQKFAIKGAQATFNQVLNIHSEYFSLVEEANADNVIDLNEMSFLVQEIPKGISVLERAKSALNDLGKKDFADKTQEKIDTFKEFMRSLDEALDITKLPEIKFNPYAELFLFLSVIALDRIYFSPKKAISYFFPLLCCGTAGIFSIIYLLFLNPSSPDGYWGYRKHKTLQKANNKLAVAIKEFTTQQIAKY